MKIAIVHYHARPGGVTRVVERAVDALGSAAECLFFTGEPAQQPGPLQEKIRPVAGLGYSRGQSGPPPELEQHARAAFGGEPDLWHIHNHSLGKNPALTAEVCGLATSGKKILLQIHDFAEDGRPANYRNLGELKNRLYPVAPHIHYAVLNRRDFLFLKGAGIPDANLHLLPNAVTPVPPAGPRPPTGEPLFVYPCRAIRRKNIGELLLWSAAMPQIRFAVTLAPQNPEARPVYDAWVAFAAELGLRTDFDIGSRRPFSEVMSRADRLITTSIAEGFGLAFLEPWLAGKPLIGRNLPEITADFAEHGLDLSSLYSRLPVPLSCNAWNLRDLFFSRLETGLQATLEAYGRPWIASAVPAARAALVHDGTVDFGILDEDMQRILIRAIRRDPGLLPFTPGDSMQSVVHNRAVTRQNWCPAAYGRRLTGIYQTLLDATPGPVHYADSQTLLDEFLQPERFTLLRT